MKPRRNSRSRSVRLGFSCHLGWAAAAAVLRDGNVRDGNARDRKTSAPTIHAIRTFRLLTAAPGDRPATEPYHVAGGFEGLERRPGPADPAAVVSSGLKKQAQTTTDNLRQLTAELADWPAAELATVLTARGKQAHSLTRILASHAQIHIAEGNAVRRSISSACQRLGMTVTGLDRRSLSDSLLAAIGRDEADGLVWLKQLTPDNDGAWRKEEKICVLAALLAGR